MGMIVCVYYFPEGIVANHTSEFDDLGRQLHQAPGLQPNPVRSRALPRFRLDDPTTHGRTLPATACASRYAPRILALEEIYTQLTGRPHRAHSRGVRAHHGRG